MSYKLVLEKLKDLKSKELIPLMYRQARATINQQTGNWNKNPTFCYCALGALNPVAAKDLPQMDIFNEHISRIVKYAQYLYTKYKLTLSEASALQSFNDGDFDSNSKRYEAVIKWLEEKVKEEDNNNLSA